MGEFKNGTIGMTSGKITTCLYTRKREKRGEGKRKTSIGKRKTKFGFEFLNVR